MHAATIAEYAITVLLALAHRVPRMVEWQRKGVWPPDEQRWSLFVPTELRGSTLGIIGYGSIGRELARIATTAFGMTVLACKRDPSRREDSTAMPCRARAIRAAICRRPGSRPRSSPSSWRGRTPW